MYTQVIHDVHSSYAPVRHKSYTCRQKKKQNTGCRIINAIAYGGDQRPSSEE